MRLLSSIVLSLALNLLACHPSNQGASQTSDLTATESVKRITNIYVRPPLKTKGRYIVDKNNRRVKLRSINWYGASDDYFTPLGLYALHRDQLAKQIVTMNFNSVRLPYSNQLLARKQPVISKFLTANHDLIGKNPLQVLDAVIESLTKHGIMVILNNHSSHATWCCSNNDNNGLWFNESFPQYRWINDWKQLADRYKNNELVIGADLRNELRRNNEMNISPDWGNGGRNDWRKAATEAGNAILRINPHWLIIVEGLNYSTDFTKIKESPLRLIRANRIVYSPHSYHWFTQFDENTSFKEAERYWDEKWGFFVKDLNRPYTAPLWISEFGNGLISNKPGSKSRIWWKHLMCYMQKNDIDYAYWSLTGGKIKPIDGPDTPKTENVDYKIYWNQATYGLNDKNWNPIQDDFRLKDIKRFLYPNRKPKDSPALIPCST